MRLTDTDEQRALRSTVRRLLDRQADSAAVRRVLDSELGYDPALWARLCDEIGVAALAVPERHGGAGASIRETLVVLEELGRGLTPSPLLGTALATEALLATGDEAGCARWLPRVAEGALLPTLVWAQRSGGWDPARTACTATESATGWSVSGEAHHVLDGDLADVLLVVAAGPDGAGLFAVDPDAAGVEVVHTPAMDPTRRLALVRLDDAPGSRLGGEFSAALHRLRDTAAVLISAEQVGAAERALALTVDYTRTRTQFGRPIGGFQALKHRMADLLLRTETARSASAAAGWALVHDPDARELAAAVAAAHCAESLRAVAAEMIQLHGGIGITWEHDAQLYFKRAHGSALLFGSPGEHTARIGRLTGVTG